MRWPVALIVLFTIPFQTVAQESVQEMSSSPEKFWGKTRDNFSLLTREQEEARIRAFVRELLGEEHPVRSSEAPVIPELKTDAAQSSR